MFRFHYLNDEPIIDVKKHPDLKGNANGASLIAAPHWLHNPPGKFLLYFAHHEGRSIRLATSDHLESGWQIYPDRPLSLENSEFAVRAPTVEELHPQVLVDINANADGNYPHIASPDIWVDHDQRQIRLYYHGRMQNGLQRTRVALSGNGVDFSAQEKILGLPYFRVFKFREWFYAIAMPGRLYRSRDGLGDFEQGPKITNEPIRHHALLWLDQKWYCFWTRVGDAPERILVSPLITAGGWHHWTLGESVEVHRPGKLWEGANMPNRPSAYGAIKVPVNQLRDPAIFQHNARTYLLYAIAGEQGIGIGELQREV